MIYKRAAAGYFETCVDRSNNNPLRFITEEEEWLQFEIQDKIQQRRKTQFVG